MMDLSLARPGESCVGNDTIAAYVARELHASAHERIGRHISRCDACRRVVSEVVRGEARRKTVLADAVARWNVATSETNDDFLVFAAVFALVAAVTALVWQVL